MALVDFQIGLARLVGAQQGTDPLDGLNLDPRESQYLEAVQTTSGFLFSRSIQRSWCIGRAAKGAHLTLSFLPENQRQQLLDEWIDSGAGNQSFFEAEAGSFLEFISRRLINPSHELSICQLEQTTLRVGEGKDNFVPPEAAALDYPHCRLSRGRYAGLVEFYAEPHRLLESLQKHEPLPPLSSEVTAIFLGPGVPQFCHTPSSDEAAVWDALQVPQSLGVLHSKGHERDTLKRLLNFGIIEYSDQIC
ncbi:MAG TPA: hypothetical protein DC047_17970 [Blastocatellia bacterium]|nr:hypothetical protein [Blastocatellia bacterium]